jgi:DNA-binding transcriptional ArsR family regulator
MANDAFTAVAHPIRRGIVERLARGPATVGVATRGFGVSKPTISKHLKVLERAGLVARGREAQRRPRTLVAAPLKSVDEWLEAYRRFWEQKFASLDDYLGELQNKERRRGKTKRR